ncbi:hypothetical protein PtB15_2B430 [Puccinia triticina]|nr:hypothetical protein PtB15_2B430 [Puccinia triticina]
MNQGLALDAPSAGTSSSLQLATQIKDLLLQLQSNLFPKLRNEVIKLCDLLERPHSMLKLMQESQPALDEIWHNLDCAVAIIYPNGQDYALSKTNDQHTNELKSYRLEQLEIHLLELTRVEKKISPVCHRYYELQHLKDPAEDVDVREELHCSKFFADEYTSYALHMIDLITGCLKDSEIDLVQSRWASGTGSIDGTLVKLLRLINLKTQIGRERVHPLRIQAIHLGELLIPIIKLTRLFFRKLPRLGMNKKWPLFTKMSSAELDDLDYSAHDVASILHDFLIYLEHYSNPNNALLAPYDLLQAANHLKANLESALLKITVHIVPLIAETSSSLVQRDFSAWLITWRTETSVAIQQVVEAYKNFTML